MSDTAITPTRAENFPEWYQSVVRHGELAEHAPVRGCMVIKPWGYGIWERIQRLLDDRIKETGHENAYFPLFIPVSFLEKEAAHIDGFAKECAVVTHHRLESKDGKLVPAGPLEEPLVVRPTSETIIGDAFSRWVQSYRDLPLLINQWANVVRWEMRTRLFLRTSEFLWQEGHTVHASSDEALAETKMIHEMYYDFVSECMAMPCVRGEKPAYERFPGAENSFSIEAMMQDGKALQAGTSHYLGQNFSKACGIKFLNEQGELTFGYTTSWGVSTRLIGGMLMMHGDDNGVRLPPRIAPHQIAILPVTPKADSEAAVRSSCVELNKSLNKVVWANDPIRSKVDLRDLRGGEKNWQWIKKGVPLRVEIGPRDLESGKVVVYRRDRDPKEKLIMDRHAFIEAVPQMLQEIQDGYRLDAEKLLNERTRHDITTQAEFVRFFGEAADEGRPSGFVVAPWSESAETESILSPLKVSVRCIPTPGDAFYSDAPLGPCVLTGKPATVRAVFARSY